LVLSRPNPDYILTYYCGNGEATGAYPGALVLTRAPEGTEIPADVVAAFDAALQAADFEKPIR
ncbi:hypothetical protein HK102_010567, partial [Quaeritorhiza haematococci]